ncbi:flagellar hook-length control protein FliK [Candidatus Latescibacterota bacterium]
MRITGPIPPSERHVTKQLLSTSFAKHVQGTGNKANSNAARLAALFVNKGLEIHQSEVRTLTAEFSAMGMTMTDIDGDSALRALLLHRHSIPLTPELVKNAWGDSSSVLNRMQALREQAISLLSDSRLSGEERAALEMLINDIDGLFSGKASPAAVKFVQEDIISNWAHTLETVLRRAVGGDMEALSAFTGERIETYLTVLNQIEYTFPEDLSDTITGRFAGMLREAVSDLHSHIARFRFGEAESVTAIKEAVAALGNRLSALAGEIEAFMTAGGTQDIQSGMIAGFFREQVRELEQRLLAGLDDDTMEIKLFRSEDGEGTGMPFREILQRSGMAFEWRLLAWYRSGRDPDRLRALVHEDIKGILMNFVGDRKKHTGRGRVRNAQNRLLRDAHAVLDSITERQLANVLNNHAEKRGLYLEFPFDEKPGRGHGKLWARGNKKQERNTFDPKSLSLTFTLDTSRLGTVDVSMAFSGKSVSLDFVLEDSKVCDLGEEMVSEFRESLQKRGFAARSVRFSERGHETKDEKPGAYKKKPGGVDLVG